MISSPTVLVLGAGASRPYGFPTAAELKELICGRFQEGSEACRLFDERSEFYTTYNFVEFRNAFRKSGKASVDAFLEHRPEFIDVGKLAIAYCLRPFEREDSLFDANAIGSSDWYQYLFERLSTTFDEFRQNKLAIITFNYDRSLEHYLLVALRNTYGRDIDECIDVLRAIPIVHVYGQLSRHPYPFDKGSLAYRTGGDEYFAAVNAAAGISLLHEAEPALDQAKALLDGAERVCFLGFGYHPTNVERLRLLNSARSRSVFGTARGLIGGEIDAVENTLQRTLLPGAVTLEDVDNLVLLRKYQILR